jgi:hypothetical protein
MGYVVLRIDEVKAELAAMPEIDPRTREVAATRKRFGNSRQKPGYFRRKDVGSRR